MSRRAQLYVAVAVAIALLANVAIVFVRWLLGG